MTELFWICAPFLFAIALLYTSVGLGGGSSYIAFLVIFGLPLAVIPPLALFFNIIASSVAGWRFFKNGYVVPRIILPVLFTSLPAAFIGARMSLSKEATTLIFVFVLLAISLQLFFKRAEAANLMALDRSNKKWLLLLLIGIISGFLAGLMGIGGGVFLGPLLLLIGRGTARQVAGTCSIFVLANSAIGLLSHVLHGNVEPSKFYLLGFAVLFGALIGSFFGSNRFSALWLQRIFALVLLAAACKLVIGLI